MRVLKVVLNTEAIITSSYKVNKDSSALGHFGAVDKVPDHLLRAEKGNKKDAYRRHPIHLIILFKFKAVAERRQWSSAASKPRRKTRVKLCPHF